MKIKTILVFILAAALFTGCGSSINQENAVEKYNFAVDMLFNSDSYTISGKTDINMSEEGKENINMGMTMTAELKEKKEENGNITAVLETVFKLADITEEGGGYYKEGFFYPKALKQKVKTAYEGMFSEGNINIFKISDKVIIQGTKPEVEKTDEGYRIDFELDADALKQEIPDFITNFIDYLRVSEAEFSMNTCHVSAVIGDDDNLKSCDITGMAQVELYDGTSDADFRNFIVDCDFKITENISKINSTEVILPDNLDEYTDVTPKEEAKSAG